MTDPIKSARHHVLPWSVAIILASEGLPVYIRRPISGAGAMFSLLAVAPICQWPDRLPVNISSPAGSVASPARHHPGAACRSCHLPFAEATA